MENRVNFSISPIGNSVDFYFKSHKKSIYSISNTLLIVEDCKYTCPGLGCAGYVVGCAGYVVGGLRRLCGGSDSDNRASLSSTSTELANWNRAWQKTIQTNNFFYMGAHSYRYPNGE